MENLIFSLNATVPIFLLMILGLLFHKIAVLHFLELHLYRIYMEMQEWHRL